MVQLWSRRLPISENAQSPEFAHNFPLFTQGWVCQERILAPRIVHFARQELRWECIEVGVCQRPAIDLLSDPVEPFKPRWESKPISRHESLYKEISLITSTGRHRRLQNPSSDTSRTLFMAALWHQIASEYSRLRLTVPWDRLAAISEIADVIYWNIECHYLAGLRGRR